MMGGIVIALLMIVFIAGWIWAWRPARREEFDAAARMPLEDDEKEMRT